MPRLDDLRTLRRTTRDAVAVAGVEIALNRQPPMVEDGYGGVRRAVGAPQTIPKQKFILSGLNSKDSSPTAARQDELPEGERYVTRYIMVSDNVAADVQKGDTFDLDGRHYEVKSVLDDRRYQTKCEVEVIGG